jgi:hypothetical protein
MIHNDLPCSARVSCTVQLLIHDFMYNYDLLYIKLIVHGLGSSYSYKKHWGGPSAITTHFKGIQVYASQM